MDIDIIGSSFTRKLTEFKNFPFKSRNIIEGQSIVSLFSAPLPTNMDELDSTDLEELKYAYRDLNKSQLADFQEASSEYLLLDLEGELGEIAHYNKSYFTASSIALLKDTVSSDNMSRIEKFRAFQNTIDAFLSFLTKYESVILLEHTMEDEAADEFIKALYQLIEHHVPNLLIVRTGPYPYRKDMPLEIYHDTNVKLKKLGARDYSNQLLFEETFDTDRLSLFMNYIGYREYVYELYKDGSPFSTLPPTSERQCVFQLTSSGKYRIRVTALDTNINPRFSAIYEYYAESESVEHGYKYIVLPDNIFDWHTDILLKTYDIEGFIGNPFKYPIGFKSLPVFHRSEVNSESILEGDQIQEQTFHILKDMEDAVLEEMARKYREDKMAQTMIQIVRNEKKQEP